jgi:hypothetical protein
VIAPVDLEACHRETIRAVSPYTVTSDERIAALCTSVEYVVDNQIPGSFVECGVWRGGSMMAVAFTLLRLGVSDRDLFLFDTFAGMTAAEAIDTDYRGVWKPASVDEGELAVSLEDVRSALARTGYDPTRVHLVEGRVEDTLPDYAPAPVALLRLDTDFYRSTLHELTHLYPRLVEGGVLVVDDYGHFRGARRAVDEYLSGKRVLLNRIDYSGRIAVKQSC